MSRYVWACNACNAQAISKNSFSTLRNYVSYNLLLVPNYELTHRMLDVLQAITKAV